MTKEIEKNLKSNHTNKERTNEIEMLLIKTQIKREVTEWNRKLKEKELKLKPYYSNLMFPFLKPY